MIRRGVLVVFLVAVWLVQALGAEKLKLGLTTRTSPGYVIPMRVADEMRAWEKNGLDVEWIPFPSASPMIAAVVANQVMVGLGNTISLIPAISRGAPITMVSQFSTSDDFFVWVVSTSRVKEVKDLRGAKIGVARFGGSQHIFGQVVVKSASLEKEVKFVATGGPQESMAALKTGRIDALVLTFPTMANFQVTGQARQVAAASDHLPRPWLSRVFFGRKEFVAHRSEAVKKTIETTMQALEFMRAHPAWTTEKLKSLYGYSDEAAGEIYRYEMSNYLRDPRVETRALENVRAFLISWGMVAKEKMPPLEALYQQLF